MCRADRTLIISILTEDRRKARAYVEAMGSEVLKKRRMETVRAGLTPARRTD